MANSAVLGIIRNVVNTGIRMQARTENEEINTKIEALWNAWCQPAQCDVTGQQSFYEMQRMILRRKIVDGEILCKLVTNRKKGLRIAVISKPMIGNSTRCKTAKRAPFGETGCGLRGEWLHEGGRENRPTFGRVRSQAVTTAVKRAFMRQFGWYRRNLTSCPLF